MSEVNRVIKSLSDSWLGWVGAIAIGLKFNVGILELMNVYLKRHLIFKLAFLILRMLA